MTSKVHVRPATASEHEFLKHLHHEAFRDVATRQCGVWNEAVVRKRRLSDTPLHRRLYERHGFVVTGETATHFLMTRHPGQR